MSRHVDAKHTGGQHEGRTVTGGSCLACAQAQDFLRGPEREATFRDMFASVLEARSWASKHFGWGSNSRDGYEADAVAAGIGRKAYVTVTKTRKAYDKAVRQYESDVAELRKIQRMLGGAAAAARLLGRQEDGQTVVAAAAGGGSCTDGAGAAGEGAGNGRKKRGRGAGSGGDGGGAKAKAARGEEAVVGKGVAAGGAKVGAGARVGRPTRTAGRVKEAAQPVRQGTRSRARRGAQ